jgi:oligopeptide/dipeptide ABC transporter ATP-binding protein
MTQTDETLLSVDGLSVRFWSDERALQILDGLSFRVVQQQCVALVGESGCGKSVTARSIMRLLQTPPAEVTAGSILFAGEDLLQAKERRLCQLRGNEIAMIFQDPLASLNPVYSVGRQVVEAIRLHQRMPRAQAKQLAVELLTRVGLADAAERFDDYPHQLSGGMRQRALIAMAISCSPQLLIADEPTTALDMVASAQITALLDKLRHATGMSLLLISHDLELVADIADEIMVLYAGRIVESGPADQVMANPLHPYTRGLLQSVPPLRDKVLRRRTKPELLPVISGSVPDDFAALAGCRFAPRCPDVEERCGQSEPSLVGCGERAVRCYPAQDRAGQAGEAS